jgi:hypothetical protein
LKTIAPIVLGQIVYGLSAFVTFGQNNRWDACAYEGWTSKGDKRIDDDNFGGIFCVRTAEGEDLCCDAIFVPFNALLFADTAQDVSFDEVGEGELRQLGGTLDEGLEVMMTCFGVMGPAL